MEFEFKDIARAVRGVVWWVCVRVCICVCVCVYVYVVYVRKCVCVCMPVYVCGRWWWCVCV